MRLYSRFNITRALLALVLLAAVPGATRAQTGEDQWARWWYGVYGGGNINMFSGALHGLGTLDTSVASPDGFTAGSGFGLALGGILEFNSGGLLGGNVMVGYNNRSVTFDRVTTSRGNEDLVASLAYVTIEPNVRINLGSRFFHLMIGPSFAINVAKGYEYGLIDTATREITHAADLADVRSFVIGAQAGLGYDIALTDISARPQMLLTPFAQFHLGQPLLDPPDGSRNEFKLNTIRVGVELKFGSPAAATTLPDDPVVAGEFSVRAPGVITDSRRLNETFPMRNYIFFDPGSTDIPARYTKLSSGQAGSFREEQLLKPSNAGTGNDDASRVRSNRQMEVYYNVMNVFADRLRRNPSASIRLVGSANGNSANGKKMAESVRDYMVNTFGIEAGRITAEGSPMPEHKSGSGAATGDDKAMIDAENNRVEIIATPNDIMKPLNIVSVQEEPIDNDVVFTLPSREGVDEWTVTITDNTGRTMNYGPYRLTTVARVDSKELLGTRSEGRFTAKIASKMTNGQTVQYADKEFRLVRADADEEQTGTRYSVLFEFDESKTVQTYEQFLMEAVAPNIPDGAAIIIHGHTDMIGEPDYNAKLSQRRSDEAQRILTRELTKAGKKVTFDTYGFGEDERRSPFNNTLPEQRYYNRTVVIEVVPGK